VIAHAAGGHGYGDGYEQVLAIDSPNPHAFAEASDTTPTLGAATRGESNERTPATLTVSPADKARYQSMVAEHFDAVWRTLRGLGVPADAADDAAQRVFIIALRKLAVITLGSERPFLLGTAVGVAANARRDLARAREVADPAAILASVDPGPDPEQAVLLSERRALVQHVLDGMPDELRTVFVLFELEGMTSIEIGEMLAIPTGTAASRLRRAREHFQTEVGRILAQSRHRTRSGP
jgi:RNA polymerase sigma-70 factor (ECF subfamily)